MKSVKLYVDMDDVLVDFVGAMFRAHNVDRRTAMEERRTYDIRPVVGKLGYGRELSLEEFWKPVIDRGHHFWEQLMPTPWFTPMVKMLERFDDEFILISDPSAKVLNCPKAYYGKVRWIRQHMPRVNLSRVRLQGMKHEHARPNHMLIDDAQHNCYDWAKHGGISIHFPRINPDDYWGSASIRGLVESVEEKIRYHIKNSIPKEESSNAL